MPITRSISLPDDVAAILDAMPNRSAAVADAVRWAHLLGLTAGRVEALAGLVERLGTLGVDDPIDSAATIAERAVADSLDAVNALTVGGWRGGEVLAVMQAMMSALWTRGMPLGAQLAAEMVDSARLGTVDLDGWGVAPERWADLAERVAASPEDARALLDVARVFWATQGSQIERMLRRA